MRCLVALLFFCAPALCCRLACCCCCLCVCCCDAATHSTVGTCGHVVRWHGHETYRVHLVSAHPPRALSTHTRSHYGCFLPSTHTCTCTCHSISTLRLELVASAASLAVVSPAAACRVSPPPVPPLLLFLPFVMSLSASHSHSQAALIPVAGPEPGPEPVPASEPAVVRAAASVDVSSVPASAPYYEGDTAHACSNSNKQGGANDTHAREAVSRMSLLTDLCFVCVSSIFQMICGVYLCVALCCACACSAVSVK